MNWVDGLLTGIILVGVWGGWSRGFILGASDLIGWIGGLLTTFALYPFVNNLLQAHTSLGEWSVPVSFIITLVLLRILIAVLVHAFLRYIPAQTHYTIVNKSLGIMPGFINGVLFAIIAAVLLLTLPLLNNVSDAARSSKLANRLTQPAEWAESKLAPIFDKAVNRTLTKLTVEPKSDETVTLPFKATEVKVRPDLENEMLQLVNNERVKAGLSTLKPDPALTEVARAHSKDMFARGYFSHYTPEGKDPFYRMKKAGVRFLSAGENLALAQTLSIAH